MSTQAVSFWRFLEGLQRLRLKGRLERWQARLIASQDLRWAEDQGDVAAARTAIAAATMRMWSDRATLPAQARATLEAMGVRAAW